MELKQIISECASGSITAQRYLFDLYANRFMLVCLRYLKQKEDAEEALMNGFLQIYKSLDRFDWKSDIATIAWMKKIMVNECLIGIRSKHRFLTVVEEHDAENVSIEETMFDNFEVKLILKCLEQLPVGYRTVFNLYVIECFSHKEIADLLKISEGTSKSQLSKARGLLQKIILQQNNYTNHAAK
jgi:RNA polymerase sigma factor (sigma-70 family)